MRFFRKAFRWAVKPLAQQRLWSNELYLRAWADIMPTEQGKVIVEYWERQLWILAVESCPWDDDRKRSDWLTKRDAKLLVLTQLIRDARENIALVAQRPEEYPAMATESMSNVLEGVEDA